jgi:hypothetical protein
MFDVMPSKAPEKPGQRRVLICVFCNQEIAPWYICRKPTHVISGTGFGGASQYACDDCMETHRRAEVASEAGAVQMGMNL